MSLLVEGGFDRGLWDPSCSPHSQAPCSHLLGSLPCPLCSSHASLPAVPAHQELTASKPLLIPFANHRPHLSLLFMYLLRSPALHTVPEVTLPSPCPSALLCSHLLYFSPYAITIRPFISFSFPFHGNAHSGRAGISSLMFIAAFSLPGNYEVLFAGSLYGSFLPSITE